MFGHNNNSNSRGGQSGNTQVCQFFLQGRCKFGGTLELQQILFLQQEMLIIIISRRLSLLPPEGPRNASSPAEPIRAAAEWREQSQPRVEWPQSMYVKRSSKLPHFRGCKEAARAIRYGTATVSTSLSGIRALPLSSE
jgi:hypothetical protein